MPETTVRWIQGTQLIGVSGTGHAVVLDTPIEGGGTGSGATPMELLLLAHAGCTAIDVVQILKDKMRKPMTGLEVRISGLRADTPPRVYTHVDVTYVVRGQGLEVKDVIRAIQLSADKYCSVSVMIAKTASIAIRYQIVDEAGGELREGTLEHAQ
ncbi:MAG: OsmC family protein [Pseudomonadota bacterium]